MLKLLEPENIFDARQTFIYPGDFAGESDQVIFEWKYSIDIENPELPDINPDRWQTLVSESKGLGIHEFTIEASGVQVLEDKWITCRYRGYKRCGSPNDWSAWSPPMLYENWIKRVTRAINPFEERYKKFHSPEGEIGTYVSMIQQAGPRYEGNIALSNDSEYLKSIGLIECYETLLNLAKKMSIDGTPSINSSVANNAILFAASRISNLYMLLGNEAYGDACDPTIGFTTKSENVTSAPSLFCFQNQVDSLLQEELELLRGRDNTRNPDIGLRPIYNRLIWNFTGNDGQTAYVMNYAVESEDDAKKMYPQGHGDAWGYYLSAIKAYYELLRHPNYTWIPYTEEYLVGGAPVSVDYLDERTFVVAAAAKARTGGEIVNMTYRNRYVDDPNGQWQGYKDNDNDRSWGFSEWVERVGQGAYFDWVVANAILPENDTNPEHTGIKKIDRHSITEISVIASRLMEIQAEVDKANIGLNPLGIDKNAIPFDISPTDIDNQKTFFEQIYERTIKIINIALSVFDHANKHTQRLRENQDSVEDFNNNMKDREADFNNRLIEIFGLPYPDDLGPGCTYPAGYNGPDIYHFAYVDPSLLNHEQMPKIREFIILETDHVDIDPEGGLTKQTKEVKFHISTEGFGLIKPHDWSGKRKVQGEIQQSISELIKTKARFEKALIEYNNLISQIEDETNLLTTQFESNTIEMSILQGEKKEQMNLNNEISKARQRQMDFNTQGRLATIVANAVAEGFPQNLGFIGGLANGVIGDFSFTMRSAVRLAGTAVSEIMSKKAESESIKELSVQQSKEMVQNQSNITLTSLKHSEAIDHKLKQIEQLIRSEATIRLELYTLQESIQQASGRYMAALARGERLLSDRTRFRQQMADQIREYRYKDMTFRIFRNDALQKYRAQFDLAALYTYLTAKAYDYDSCLLNSNEKAGEQFFTNIVSQRTIGEINNGSPITGTGLSDTLAQLYQNFIILKPKMGFNNPQIETNRFSVREELFRIKADAKSSQKWKETLISYKVDNIWNIKDFRRYCAPFAPENDHEPAIVIPFTTNITSGLNFFGWPLAGGDSYYDSSLFATRIRGVGLWFSNYDNNKLAETPRVYFIPVGEDITRVPYTNSFDVRTFRIVDQVIPIPFDIQPRDFEDRDWIPLMDSISGSFTAIKKHSRFKAHLDNDNWSNELVNNTQIIGRSVWNSKWLLIIPGVSLGSDKDDSLNTFIDTVTDIKFIFKTYSYRGGARKKK
jgi:hypothetical protein